jgi:anti-anti-sigma factor
MPDGYSSLFPLIASIAIDDPGYNLFYKYLKENLIMLEVTSYNKGPVLVATLTGRVDSSGSKELEAQLLVLIDANQADVVLDCSGIAYISSAGLRIFLMAAKKTKSLNGRIRLSGLQEPVQDVFEISGFTKLFEIFPTLDEALAS